ncbi:hypothetical protein F5Y02DRAFT_372443 [Annulohypoxylon stygium]|nr:hypothetical protein F5Y02DRAFT_372443 [Annulohypoxylon stygium]
MFPSGATALLTTAFLALTHTTTAAAPKFPLAGHDFDFTFTYPSGLEISTSNPPNAVLSASEITRLQPQINLAKPNISDRYIAFLEINVISETNAEVGTTFPFILTNLTALSNGTLDDSSPDCHRILQFSPPTTSEVRNATAHVWQQSDALGKLVNGDQGDTALALNIGSLWYNISYADIIQSFSHANVDFKVKNETGVDRNDVDDNGARISPTATGSVSSTFSAPFRVTTGTSPASASASTSAPVLTSGLASSSASDSASATTSDAEGATATPNDASTQLALESWIMVLSGSLLLTEALLAI